MSDRTLEIINKVVPGLLILVGILLYASGLSHAENAARYVEVRGMISDVHEVQVSDWSIRNQATARYLIGGAVYEWEMDEFKAGAYQVGETVLLFYDKDDPYDVINYTKHSAMRGKGSMMQFVGYVLGGLGSVWHSIRIVRRLRDLKKKA